jgi:putative ABC transport system substrate-binding protein
VRRREFIFLFGGAAALWPQIGRAQQPERVRRIGFLHDYDGSDPEGRRLLTAFRDALQALGWIEGRNVLIEYRAGGAADSDRLRTIASEMVSNRPDVVLSSGATATAALQRANRNLPVVFVNVTDPVGAGLVTSLARPEGNATGFTQFEFGISVKWLELLKEVAPTTKRVGVIRDPTALSGGGQLGAIQAVAPSLGVDVKPIDPHSADDIERGITALVREPNGGLVVTSTRLARANRDLIVSLAARHRIPAVYAFRIFVAGGGLMFYGPDATDPYRRVANYIDRILKGEHPSTMPVQAPTKYELVINLKAAKALGLAVPPTLLARADDTIE